MGNFNPPAPTQKDKGDETELRKALSQITEMINRSGGTTAAASPTTIKSAEYTIAAVVDGGYADNTWTKVRDTLTTGFGATTYLTITDPGIYIITGYTQNTTLPGALAGAYISVNASRVAFSYASIPGGGTAANAAVTMYLAANDQVQWFFYNVSASQGRLGITRIGAA